MLRTILTIMLVTTLWSCGEEDESKFGKITLTMNMYDPDKSTTDSSITLVTYGCVVLSSSSTACLYYYNGTEQLDGQVSTDAASAGPGSDGYTYVADGATISDLEGGSRTYTFSKTSYQNGSVSGTPVTYSGELDLYANKGSGGSAGETVNWVVSFGSSGAPTVNNN